MKKIYTLAHQRATISDLRVEASGLGSNADCPKDGRGQVDDFTRVYAKQRSTRPAAKTGAIVTCRAQANLYQWPAILIGVLGGSREVDPTGCDNEFVKST